jgi:hypothetical protein
LGVSFGKVLDLVNINNTTYALLHLFEEYSVYTNKKNHLEDSAIFKFVLPNNSETIASQGDFMKARCQEMQHLSKSGVSGTAHSKTNMEFKNLVPYQEAPRKNFDEFCK